MIKKSLLLFVFFLLIFECLIRYFPNNDLIFQSIRQRNVIKAQDFIYENYDKDMIISGSSLSGRIILNSTGMDLYDLSFSGMGPAEGINILSKIKTNPRVVLVETNFIDRGLRDEFDENIFNPVTHQILMKVHSLRLKNQPLNYLSSLKIFRTFRHAFSRYINNFFKKPGNAGIQSGAVSNDNDTKGVVFSKTVKIAVELFQKVPREDRLNTLLGSIKVNLDQLSEKGAKVIFFEMPMHPKVSDSPKANFIRQSMRKIFPENDYIYLSTPDPHNFQTTDGYHLDRASAEKYTLFFSSELNKIMSVSSL